MVALELDQRLSLMMSSRYGRAVPPPGVRGLDYIVRSDESGPLDQTDIEWTVFLNPLGWWSVIRETERDWWEHQGGCPED